MDRIEILRDYNVVNGIIRSPGKFEGEPLYVPFLWFVCVMVGGGEFVGGESENTVRVWIEPADRVEFPELTNVAAVLIWEREDGFVCSQVQLVEPSAA